MITEHFIKVRKDVLSDGKDLGRLGSIQESDLKKILFFGGDFGSLFNSPPHQVSHLSKGGRGVGPIVQELYIPSSQQFYFQEHSFVSFHDIALISLAIISLAPTRRWL